MCCILYSDIINLKKKTVADKLANSGIDKVSVSLLCDTPKQYQHIMQPKFGTFGDVCSFIIACSGSHSYIYTYIYIYTNKSKLANICIMLSIILRF